MQPDFSTIGLFRDAEAASPAAAQSSGAHALRRVFPGLLVDYYLNNPTNITHVISANAINNVLWPHRATIPTIFLSSVNTNRAAGFVPVGTCPFMGAEVYISRCGRSMLQVSKTAFSRRIMQKTIRARPAKSLDIFGEIIVRS
jgi:hypothetical protein